MAKFSSKITGFNNAFAMATKPDLAMYYHRAAFSPVPTKFITAINNDNLSTWPGLTADLISKHLPKSLATSKVHNKISRKNVRSTRPQEPLVARTKTIQITVVEPSDLLATDITGRFSDYIKPGLQLHNCVLYL